MNFEIRVKEYIITLKNDNVIIDADIYGVNEELKTSKCLGRFLIDGVIEEKYMYIYEVNESLTWSYLKPIEIQPEL